MKAVIGLLALLGIPTFVVALVMWNGLFLSIVWAMVMVTYFNAPEMSIPVAIAVASVVSLLTNHNKGDEKTDDEKKYMPIFVAALRPPLCLLVVWLALKFA